MTRLREANGMSQAELVQKLRTNGWTNVHPTTISRIEKGERPVRLSEATRIARILGQDVSLMMRRPSQAGVADEAERYAALVCESYNQISEGVFTLLRRRFVFRNRLNELKEVAERENDPELEEQFEELENYLGLRVDKAVETGRQGYNDTRVTMTADFQTFYGISANTLNPEDIDRADIDAAEA